MGAWTPRHVRLSSRRARVQKVLKRWKPLLTKYGKKDHDQVREGAGSGVGGCAQNAYVCECGLRMRATVP